MHQCSCSHDHKQQKPKAEPQLLDTARVS